MKLLVKSIDAVAVPGGRAFALCDELGEMLPLQVSSTIRTGVDAACEITVTFLIDGETIRISD